MFRFKVGTTAIALTISSVICVNTGVAADAVTVVSWGGAYTRSQVEALHKPFSSKTGIQINSVDYNGGLAQVKAQVNAGNVTWDVVDVDISSAVRGCDEGLFEKIDHSLLPPAPDGTPATKDFIGGSLIDCGVPSVVWSTIYAYDSTKVKGKPTTIADFFNTKKFPGKRGMRKSPKANLEMALIADGVPAAAVYRVLGTSAGVERAFAKLDSIKKDIVWWEAGAQPPQLLADGEVVMTTAYNGRIFNAIADEKKPFEIVWDGQVFDIDFFVIPKGSKNKKAALQYISFATDTQRLADQAAWISYGPARKSSSPLVGKHATAGVEMAPHMPTAPANFGNVVQNDYEFWADRQDELNDAFNSWINRRDNWITAPETKLEKATVNILFGTNRKYAAKRELSSRFGADRGNPKFGWTSVSIPKAHIRGGFETPSYPFRILNYLLPKRQAKVGEHLKVTNLEILTKDEFIQTLRNKLALSTNSGFVFVHGFSTSFENAALRTAQLAFDLQPYGGVPMFFSWPSQGKLAPLAYTTDETNSEWAKKDLLNFLKEIATISELSNIHLIAHSMGNRILIPVLAKLAKDYPKARAKYKETILAAPDIDAETFERDFAPILASNPPSVTLYASNGDKALKWSKKIHTYRRLGESNGDISVYPGIDTIDLDELDASFSSHSYYAEHKSVLADMYYLIKDGFRPEKRCCLSRQSHQNGLYWQIEIR